MTDMPGTRLASPKDGHASRAELVPATPRPGGERECPRDCKLHDLARELGWVFVSSWPGRRYYPHHFDAQDAGGAGGDRRNAGSEGLVNATEFQSGSDTTAKRAPQNAS